MESLGSLDVFVRVSESRSFTAAGQQLGISASAVSKTIARLEERLSVRLFHRSTRTVNLTPEGALFLKVPTHFERGERRGNRTVANAGNARGKLRISLPSLGTLFMPKLGTSSAAILRSSWILIIRIGWLT